MELTARCAAFALALAAVLCGPVAAKDVCPAPAPECTPVGEWDLSLSFGLGTRTNPIDGIADIPLVLVPRISYYGKRFFLENLEAGFSLHEGASSTVNLIVTPGYDRAFFYRDDPQNVFLPFGAASIAELTIPRRRTTFLAGPEWLVYRGRLVAQLAALWEFTGRHEGYEVRGAVSTPLTVSRGELLASTGFTWKSTELVNYYYGVEGAYQADSAFNPFVRFSYALPVSERWTFSAFAMYEDLDRAVADSPIVAEGGVTTVFAGFALKIF